MRQEEDQGCGIDIVARTEPVLGIARKAGQAIMAVYGRMGQHGAAASAFSRKSDDSPVTAADLAAHELIARELSALTPGVPVVSEEDVGSQQHRSASGTFWLVDPLDGTREYLARNGEFTVNIALVQRGRSVWGGVFAPALDVLYWGGAGLGAWRADRSGVQPIRVASPEMAGAVRWRVLASKSHMTPETAAVIGQLGVYELVQAGSSLKFCRIAEGAADLYPRLGPTCEWDTAAAQAVLEGAGGVVLDGRHQPLRYGKPDVLNPHFVAASSRPVAGLLKFGA